MVNGVETSIDHKTPTQIADDVIEAHAGAFHAIWIQTDAPPELVFLQYPDSATISRESTLTLTATASGYPPISYQWRKNGTPIAGAQSELLSIANVQSSDSGDYDVVATDGLGSSIVSPAANITISYAPAFTRQPVNTAVWVGGTAVFESGTNAVPSPLYQWFHNDNEIVGANSAVLTLSDVGVSNAGVYHLVAVNTDGSTSSESVSLTVLDGAPPAVLASLSIESPATFLAEGGRLRLVASLTYSEFTPSAIGWTIDLPEGFWFEKIISGDVAITPHNGATGELGFAYIETPADLAEFSFEIGYPAGLTGQPAITGHAQFRAPWTLSETQPLVLALNIPPSISEPPTDQIGLSTGQVTFSVQASGTGPIAYQWRHNGVNITGATNATLVLSDLTSADAGSYSVVVSQPDGWRVSAPVSLAVYQISASHSAETGVPRGETISVSNELSFDSPFDGLVWSVLLPTTPNGGAWTFVSSDANTAISSPNDGQSNLLEWEWSALTSSPLTFTYEIRAPEGSERSLQLVAMATATIDGHDVATTVKPDPLDLSFTSPYHSADTNRDLHLSLSELLRVIELYNTRRETTRTGRYKESDDSVDGFQTDPDTPANDPSTLSRHHSADTNRDSSLSLSELLRVIELYNHREGTTRTGEYSPAVETEDGFKPGPS